MSMITLNGKPLATKAEDAVGASSIALAQAQADSPAWSFADGFFAQQASKMRPTSLAWTFTYYLRDFQGEKTAIAPEL